MFGCLLPPRLMRLSRSRTERRLLLALHHGSFCSMVTSPPGHLRIVPLNEGRATSSIIARQSRSGVATLVLGIATGILSCAAAPGAGRGKTRPDCWLRCRRQMIVILPKYGSPSETPASLCFRPSSGVRRARSIRRISAPSLADDLGSTDPFPGLGTARPCPTGD
jgi:hypothetical protein